MSKDGRKQLRKDVRSGRVRVGCNTFVALPAVLLAVLGWRKARRR